VEPSEHPLEVGAVVGLDDEVVMIGEQAPGFEGAVLCDRAGEECLLERVQCRCGLEEMLFLVCPGGDEEGAGAEVMRRGVWPLHEAEDPSVIVLLQVFYGM
jgi:hypothetical protein